LVLPAAAGSPADMVARRVAERASGTLNAPIIVENRPGANGVAAVQAVKEAPPDGSMLLFTPSAPMTLLPIAVRGVPYDPARDFAPITQLAAIDFGIAVSESTPFKTLNDVIAEAKAKPETIAYAVPGIGTIYHLVGVALSQAAGIRMQAVPYRGAAPAITDLLAGRVPVAVVPLSNLLEPYRAGRIRILAKSGSERSPLVPNVPTLRESGFDVAVSDWYGVLAPVSTPSGLVERFNGALVSAVRSSDVRERLIAVGPRPTGTTPAQLSEIQRADAQFWQRAFSAAGLIPQ
jgi:tripartite-type tricarboxylate transporter receptor subunit TctC